MSYILSKKQHLLKGGVFLFTIVICEFKKFKRMWLPLIIGVFLLIQLCSSPINTEVIKTADDVFTMINLCLFSYGFLIAINLLTAYVFIREFNSNTMGTMAIYKHQRYKLFIGKIISVILISFLIYFTEFIMLTAICFVTARDTLTLSIIIKHMILTFQAFFFQMLMITVIGCLALVTKKITMSLIYIGAQLITSMLFLFDPSVRKIIPFPLPVVGNLLLIKNNHTFLRDMAIMPSTFIIAVIMFVGGLVYGCWYMNRMDIQ